MDPVGRALRIAPHEYDITPADALGHPMKPTRIRMCHSLVMNYGLYKKMEIFVSAYRYIRDMLMI